MDQNKFQFELTLEEDREGEAAAEKAAGDGDSAEQVSPSHVRILAPPSIMLAEEEEDEEEDEPRESDPAMV